MKVSSAAQGRDECDSRKPSRCCLQKRQLNLLHVFGIIIVVVGGFLTPTAAYAPIASSPNCTVCVNGNDSLHVNQSKTITIPGLLVQTCGGLMQTAEIFQPNSSACDSIRTLGAYCGCPAPANACTLCSMKSSSRVVSNNTSTNISHDDLLLVSHKLVSNATASQFHIFGAPSGSSLSCDTLDSAIQYLAKDDDPLCEKIRWEHQDCCRYPTNETSGIELNGNLSSVSFPSFEPCHVCLDQSAILFPNKTIQLGDIPVHNCSQLETFAHIFHQANDTQCRNIQQFLGPYCGCPVATTTSGGCSLCPHGEPVPFPNRPFPVQKDFQGLSSILLRSVAEDMTCGEYESILSNVDALSEIGVQPGYACSVGQSRSAECGCSKGYQAQLITWLFRASALLSLIGSFFIIRDVARKSPERRTTYHRIILGTTCFDVITSTAYLLSGIVLPPPAYEAFGSHATCVLQGVMIQIGLTSLFYSVLLSIYYLLMIKYNWKESRFQRCRNHFHIPIIAMGMVLAAVASTSIAPQMGFCYIAIPPQASSRLRIIVLFVVPTSIALTVIIACTALTCYHVYSTEKATLRWSAKRNLSLTKKVCWQSFWYCVAFAVTVTCVMLNYYGDFRTSREFAVAAFFAPAQGFLNSLIYFKRASKGLKFTLKAAHSRWKLNAKPPVSNNAPVWDAASTLTLEPESASNNASSAEHTISNSSQYENRRDSDVLPRITEHIDCEMSGEGSDIFSAAAEHWLINDDELEEEETEAPQRRKTTTNASQSRLLGLPIVRQAKSSR